MIKFDYLGSKCVLTVEKYVYGQTALIVYDQLSHERIAVATVAIDEYVGPGEVAIKNYSENTGILEVLKDAGIVSEPKRFVSSGFVTIPICDLLVENQE